VYILYQTLQEAKCTAKMDAEELCEKLIPAITKTSYTGLTGKGLTWNAEGEVSKDPMAVVIENGAYVLP